MIANFINLCKGSPEDVITGASVRRLINLCGEIGGVYISEERFEGIDEGLWLISVRLEGIPDVKMHFREADKDKSMKLYDFLIERYIQDVSIVVLDALEWGAV